MIKVQGKKKWYDGEADWVPAKGKQFVMKGMMQKEEPPREEPKIKTDAERRVAPGGRHYRGLHRHGEVAG